MFEQKSEEYVGVCMVGMGEEHSKQQRQHEQRPCGRKIIDSHS